MVVLAEASEKKEKVMSSSLSIGTKFGTTEKFEIPVDALVQTFSLNGIRGSGKSTTAAVMAEEFYKHQLPWIALDPAGIWWGMRAGRDGNPAGGLKDVVIFGGKHGDLQIDKDSGATIADALVETNVCAVIDLSQESKTTWRKFLTAFCRRLMELSPKDPRMIFIEEAAEFVPQRTKVAVTAECKEAVERLIRLGRNAGYGATLINQRPATIDKDVLSQCENILVMRTVGKHDRKALGEWLEPKFSAQGMDDKTIRDEIRKLTLALASFADGQCYFWSPHWLDIFEVVQVRQRSTFHPGETRRVGVSMKSVTLFDAKLFVEKVRRQLEKKSVPVLHNPGKKAVSVQVTQPYASEAQTRNLQGQIDLSAKLEKANEESTRLREDLRKAKGDILVANRRLETAREFLKPQYEVLKKLFEDIAASASGNGADPGVYGQWLQKCPKDGIRKMLEYLVDKGEGTRSQLATWSGVNPKTAYDYVGWLKRNGLAEIEGSVVRLRRM